MEDITGLIGWYAHGNEPSHHVAYLYSYAGQPWRTQARLKQIMDHPVPTAPMGWPATMMSARRPGTCSPRWASIRWPLARVEIRSPVPA